MRMLTWIPRGLRDELDAIDPARTTAPARPRPELQDVLARAVRLEDSSRSGLEPVSGNTDPGSRDSRPRQHRGRFRVLLAIACSVVLVAGLATGITLATRSHHTQQPGQTAARIPHPTRSDAAGSASLYGVTWLDTASQATVVFAPGTAHMSDGCSGQSRTLSVSGRHVHLGALLPRAGYTCGGTPAPRPGSPGYPAYEREQHALARFYQVLHSTPAWSVTNHQLTLTSPHGRTLTLTSKDTAPLTLPGSRWTLQIVIPISPRAAGGRVHGPTLTFDRRGGFRATDGCNVLTGTATVEPGHVTFVTHHNTNRGCPYSPRLATAINTVDAMLSSHLDYQIEDNTLRLVKPNTDGQLIYAPTSG